MKILILYLYEVTHLIDSMIHQLLSYQVGYTEVDRKILWKHYYPLEMFQMCYSSVENLRNFYYFFFFFERWIILILIVKKVRLCLKVVNVIRNGKVIQLEYSYSRTPILLSSFINTSLYARVIYVQKNTCTLHLYFTLINIKSKRINNENMHASRSTF